MKLTDLRKEIAKSDFAVELNNIEVIIKN